MKRDNTLHRIGYAERLCHWMMVACFFLVALSGLSWLFPSLSWLNAVLGTPQLARILHPFLGVVVFLALMFLFLRLVKYNLPEREDRIWFANVKDVVRGAHDKPLRIGKYNAGQKILFWSIMVLITALLVSGIIIWRPWFAHYFPIPVIRLGLIAHSLAGIGLMLLIIGHIYLAFWVKGSIRGMITGRVTRTWARAHHDRWHEQMLAKEAVQAAAAKEPRA